jgi:hypothetical protein
MSIIKSQVLFSPDGDGASPPVDASPEGQEPAPAAPGNAPAPEGAAGEGAPPSPADPPAEGQGQEQEPEKDPWYKQRIAQLTWQRNEEARRAAELEAQNRELAAKLQPKTPPTEQQNAAKYTEEEVQRRAYYLAQSQAAQLAAQESFNNSCNEVFFKGAQEFGRAEMDNAVETFHNEYGGMPQDFVEAALETGQAHKIIVELAKDPEKAMEILSMPPGVRRAMAVAKLAGNLGSRPKTSSAPAPIRPQVGGAGKSDPGGADPSMSIDKWMKMREKEIANKG